MGDRNIKLILIEDDKIDQIVFERFIRDKDLPYDFTLATSLHEAFDKLNSQKYDIIISDFQLGDGTAFDLFHKKADTPIIVVTGTGDEEIAVRAMKYGAYDYLIKDPDGKYLTTLPITVEKTINQKRNEDELLKYKLHLEEIVTERTRELQIEIAERKKVEAALKESEEKYRVLIQNSNDAIYLLFNRKFEIINNKFEKMFEVTIEDVQQPYFDFTELVSPKSKNLIEERLEKIGRNIEVDPNYEFIAISKTGREILVEASVSYIKYKNGIATQGILRDITEKRKLEQQLLQSQKMEAIGRLAGGVAHDFNNLLTAISGYTNSLISEIDESHYMYHDLIEIEKAADRAAALTNQLLTFSRKQLIKPRVLNINTVIENIKSMLKRIIGEDIELKINLDPNLGYLNSDKSQIEQVILNLVVNAREAMPNGGTLTIDTLNANIEDNGTDKLNIPHGKYIVLKVSDNGNGMTKEVQSHLFEPFFTTKDFGMNTGLGLATVYGIVKQNDGYIHLYSEPNIGTTFNIYFPQVQNLQAEINEQVISQQDYSGSETILFVEDESIIRNLAKKILSKNGYKYLQACDGNEAINLYKNYKQKIDLIITDVVMPKMNGYEFGKKMKERFPEAKVLYMSGYTKHVINHEDAKFSDQYFLNKPFTPKILLHKIREILDQ